MQEHDSVTLKPDEHGLLYVPFTLYVRPHGKRNAVVWMTRDRVVAAKADAIIASGFVFEIEKLDKHVVSITITHREAGDMAHLLARDGPVLPAKITDMINRFDIAAQTKRVKRILDRTWHRGDANGHE